MEPNSGHLTPQGLRVTLPRINKILTLLGSIGIYPWKYLYPQYLKRLDNRVAPIEFQSHLEGITWSQSLWFWLPPFRHLSQPNSFWDTRNVTERGFDNISSADMSSYFFFSKKVEQPKSCSGKFFLSSSNWSTSSDFRKARNKQNWKSRIRWKQLIRLINSCFTHLQLDCNL